MPSKKNNKKKKNSKNRQTDFKRELIYRDEDQQYARVLKLLGNRRLTCECFDGKERLGLIRGSMRKRVWISVGDLVLIALREFQDKKCDVIHKYKEDEERYLKKTGAFESYVENKQNTKEEDDVIAFEDI
tara:strand:+ start:639 stop:1028 length:390 start_codon:yes stop_codon:yes gene_type:complete